MKRKASLDAFTEFTEESKRRRQEEGKCRRDKIKSEEEWDEEERVEERVEERMEERVEERVEEWREEWREEEMERNDENSNNTVNSKRSRGKSPKEQSKEKDKQKAREIRGKLEKNRIKNKRKFSKKMTASGYKFFCKECPFKTVVAFYARRHSYILCGEEKRNAPKKSKKKMKKRVCAMCQMEFSKAAEFNAHHRAMHVRSLPCSYCGKLLKNQEVYNKHLSTFHNNNEKNHKCNLCNYKSYRKQNLKLHMEAKHAAEAVKRPEVRSWVEELPTGLGELLAVPKIRMLGSSLLLLNLSPRNVHIVKLDGNKYKELISFSTNFDITNIEVNPQNASLVALSGKADINIYSFETDESSTNPLQMGLMVVPSSLLPSQAFTLSWIPGILGVALVSGSSVTTILTSPEEGIRLLGVYSVANSLPVASVTFCSFTVTTTIFLLTGCGSVFFGEASMKSGGGVVLAQQINVSG